jgi:Zn-dependent protease with chaperone function
MKIPVSSSFRKKTSKAIFSIFLFILVYLLLLIAAVGLTALSIYGGIMIICIHPMLLTLVAGAGLGSIGVLILIFLVKFLFKKHQVDLSSYIEIYPKDQPKLFSMIKGIVNEVGTQFPKKIYVSREVNASVFYNSSFWSMFLPVKKNLHIGMGLVNAVTEDELKAILSHEFGHFSQKSMKVGSYVYHVNQVIYNMLYDNESYNNLIASWAKVHNYLVFFVNVAIKIVEGIQSILKYMYTVVNKSYLELSREMEFHADAVAANVTGCTPMKNALLRMDLADKSYNDVIAFYNSKYEESWVSSNIFEEQSFVLQFIAKNDAIPMVDLLPMVSETQQKFKKSKIVIKNQWASHPETEDRIKALKELNIVKPIGAQIRANNLFNNLSALQEQLTQHLFADVNYPQSRVQCSLSEFISCFKKEYDNETFDNRYGGYYDNKNPMLFDLNNDLEQSSVLSFEDLYSEEKIGLVYEEIALQQDLSLLEQLEASDNKMLTFDYEGVRYKATDASDLKLKCEQELKQLEAAIFENDKNIYAFFHQQATLKNCAFQLEQWYQKFFCIEVLNEEYFSLYQLLMNGLHFTNTKTAFEVIESNFDNLQEDEKLLKQYLRSMLTDAMLQSEISTSMRANFEEYLSKEWSYFDGREYNDKALRMFIDAINGFQYLNNRNYFLIKKGLVDFQISLLN